MSEPFTLCFRLDDCCSSGDGRQFSVAEFLQQRLTAADIARLPELSVAGYIRLDCRAVELDTRLDDASQLTIDLPGHLEDEVDDQWFLLWENSELMAIFKPHCLPVSRTTRNLYNTLISLVRRQTVYADARLLHRLDSETAGIILLAKDGAADRRWKPQLDQLLIKKIYHAWVDGVPQWRSKRLTCDLAERLGSVIRSQMYVVDDAALAAGQTYLKPRSSKTCFEVLARVAGKSLLSCQLLSGRKHQIRAQLSYLGYPLVGDKIYGHQGRFYLKRIEQGLADADFTILGSKHHLLQCAALTLMIDGEAVEIVVPPALRLGLPGIML
ncbi:RluA family pseudouridine synthase [Amphritea sp.]|uniref:RluA family pseudouridine synthase n=1 Tax=Amphritea sp. TaxID=1872502 RepID=UPI003A8E1BD9